MNEFLINSNGVLKTFMGEGGNVIIPYGVSVISDGVFRDRKEITDVVFPKTLAVIGDDAFRGCTNLETITFYGGNVEIGERAFRNCPGLNTIFCFNDANYEYPVNFFNFRDTDDVAAFDVDLTYLTRIDITFSKNRRDIF